MYTTEIEKKDQWSTELLNKIDSQKIKRFIENCHKCRITNQYDGKLCLEVSLVFTASFLKKKW
jgi:hypothetical protein